MAIQNQPGFIPAPFANSGTKNVIPETMPTPSASAAASWTDGFPTVCSLPLASGGIPPARADFNGLFNSITQAQAFYQSGGVYEWDATIDYGTNRLVLGSDGLLYWSIAQSGPNVGGAQDPTLDTAQTYWASPKVPTMPAVDSSAAAASTQWVNSWYSSNVVPTDVYVDANNGDDNYDGYSVVTPKRTLSAVVNIFNTPGALIRRKHVIHVAQGTYTAPSDCGVPGTIIIYDFEAGSIVQGTFRVDGSTREVHLGGTVKFTNNARFYVNGASWLTIGSELNPLNLTIENSSAVAFLRVTLHGFLGVLYDSGASTITFSGTCSVSQGTAFADSFGYINMNNSGSGSIAFSGSVTGKRYTVGVFGMISAGSPTKFPGTANGIVNSLGSYS